VKKPLVKTFSSEVFPIRNLEFSGQYPGEDTQVGRTAGTVAAYNDLPLNLWSEAQCKNVATGDYERRRKRRTTRPRPRPTEDAPQDGIVREGGVEEKWIRRLWVWKR
jgi:hypothetical protein